MTIDFGGMSGYRLLVLVFVISFGWNIPKLVCRFIYDLWRDARRERERRW